MLLRVHGLTDSLFLKEVIGRQMTKLNPDKENKLLEYIRKWLRGEKIGSLQINTFKGGISNIKIEESKKLDDI